MRNPTDSTALAEPTKRRLPTRFIVLMITALLGIIALVSTPPLRSFADNVAPVQPTGFYAVPDYQQVTLQWHAQANTTAYVIQTTDLSTGAVTQSAPQAVTQTITISSLASGHWYRFRITPFDGSTAGPISHFIDVRTKGFSGSYNSYFAMGDSYSSGEGAPPYTDVPCARSNSSFAYHIGVGVPSPLMLACAGATTDDIDKIAQGPGGTQLWELHSGPSLTHAIITISIGGNDIGFASEMAKCITSDCTPDQAAISQKISALIPRLAQVYSEIRDSAPDADLFVIGYPLLVADPAQANCHNSTTKSGLSTSEMTMIRTLGEQFHTTLVWAAALGGATLVDGTVAFAGHEACTSNQSAEWINEITSSDINGSFHPNQLGYAGYATAVNLTRINLYTHGLVRVDPTS